MSDIVTRLILETGEFSPNVKSATKGINALIEETRKAGKSIKDVSANAVEYASSLGKMETTSKTAQGSLRELSSAYVELREQYKRLTDEEKKSPFGQSMTKSLDAMKGRINEANKSLQETKREIGDLGENVQSSSTSLSDLADKFGLNITKLTAIGAAVAAAKTAFDTFKASMSTNADVVDEFSRVTEGAKATLQGFLTSLGNGNIAQFFDNWGAMNQAGRDFYDAIDNCNTAHNTMNAAMETYRGIVDYCNIKMRDPLMTGQERKMWIDKQNEALQKQLELQKLIAQAEINKRNAEFDKNFVAAGGGTKLSEWQKQFYEAVGNDGMTNWNRLANQYDEQVKKLDARIKAGTGTGYIDVKGDTYVAGAMNEDAKRAVAERQRLINSASYKQVMAYKTMENQGQDVATSWGNRKEQTVIDNAEASAELMRNRAQNKVNNAAASTSRATITAPKIETKESITELQALQRSLEVVERTMSGYAKTSDDWKAMNEEAEDLRKKINELNGEVAASVEGLRGMSDASINEYKKWLSEDIAKTPYGGQRDVLAQNLGDVTTFQNLLHQTVNTGIDQSEFENIWAKILSGEDISDVDWKAIEDAINAQIEGLGLKPVKLNIDGGDGKDIANTGKETANAWQAASRAVGSLGSALGQVEDPAAKVFGIIAQAVANVAAGFAAALARPESQAGGVWGWVAAAAAGVATMVSTITAIRSATAGSYAEGGIVPGTSYYGDNLTANVNSGELILNKAQQNNVASQLVSNSNTNSLPSKPYLTGELIYLAQNNYLKRIGRGEIATTR